jgi:hypothetical protein
LPDELSKKIIALPSAVSNPMRFEQDIQSFMRTELSRSSSGVSTGPSQPDSLPHEVSTMPQSLSACDLLKRAREQILSNSRYSMATDFAQTNSSLTAQMTEEKTWPSNDPDIVRHLIHLQKFDGLWNLSDSDIQNLCQKPRTTFHSNMNQDPIILTTVLVIIILEMKFTSLKIMWSFIVNKARKRLTELLDGNENLEQVINNIKSQL